MEYDGHSGVRVLFLNETPVFTQDVNSGVVNMTIEDFGLGGRSLEYVVSVGTQALVGAGAIECVPEHATLTGSFTSVPDDLVLGGTTLPVAGTQGIAIPTTAAAGSIFRIGSISKLPRQRLAINEDPAPVTAGQITCIAIVGDLTDQPEPDQNS